MNKRGLVFFYRLMMGLCIIILGIAFAYPLQQVIDSKMTDLTCTAPANDFDQATCWFLDLTKPFYVGGIILIGFLVLFKL